MRRKEIGIKGDDQCSTLNFKKKDGLKEKHSTTGVLFFYITSHPILCALRAFATLWLASLSMFAACSLQLAARLCAEHPFRGWGCAPAAIS